MKTDLEVSLVVGLISQLSSDELEVLATLTSEESGSDMNRTLQDVRNGTDLDTNLRVVVARYQGRIVGWSTAELWPIRGRILPLVNTFVEVPSRNRGLGTLLRQRAQDLLEQLLGALDDVQRSRIW